jgi:hypothetical protein
MSHTRFLSPAALPTAGTGYLHTGKALVVIMQGALCHAGAMIAGRCAGGMITRRIVAGASGVSMRKVSSVICERGHTTHCKPPEGRMCRLRNQSLVGKMAPSKPF